MILNFEAEAEGIRPDTILEKILPEIPEVATAGAKQPQSPKSRSARCTWTCT